MDTSSFFVKELRAHLDLHLTFMDIELSWFFCIPLVLVLGHVFKVFILWNVHVDRSIKLPMLHIHVFLFLLFTLYTYFNQHFRPQ